MSNGTPALTESAGCGTVIAVFAFGLVLGFIVSSWAISSFLAPRYFADSYCTQFAPLFSIKENGTWECIEEAAE